MVALVALVALVSLVALVACFFLIFFFVVVKKIHGFPWLPGCLVCPGCLFLILSLSAPPWATYMHYQLILKWVRHAKCTWSSIIIFLVSFLFINSVQLSLWVLLCLEPETYVVSLNDASNQIMSVQPGRWAANVQRNAKVGTQPSLTAQLWNNWETKPTFALVWKTCSWKESSS